MRPLILLSILCYLPNLYAITYDDVVTEGQQVELTEYQLLYESLDAKETQLANSALETNTLYQKSVSGLTCYKATKAHTNNNYFTTTRHYHCTLSSNPNYQDIYNSLNTTPYYASWTIFIKSIGPLRCMETQGITPYNYHCTLQTTEKKLK